MAEGVLPILVGKATLISKYLINHNKKYIVKLQLGIKTDTADSEGNIIDKKEVNESLLNQENITKILKQFLGKQEQIPPIYSAIKVNGKKLYEYARKGQKVELKRRQIEIYDINLIRYLKEKKQIEFEVFCGKGTYIRSLCEDIASKFETVGYMEKLKRTQVGEFKIENSITVNELESNISNIQNEIISIEKIFSELNKIELDNKRLQHFLNGVRITENCENGIYRIYNINKQFIGLGIIENNLLKRDVII